MDSWLATLLPSLAGYNPTVAVALNRQSYLAMGTASEVMTVDWTAYAQSLPSKPVKGMLTGPIIVLQWAFVHDEGVDHASGPDKSSGETLG